MLERLQLDLSSPLIDCRVSPGEKPVDRAFAAMTEKLSQPIDFTALFCISDMGAMAALRALREMGHRVPQEVSVLAFADEGWMSPYLCPPLTSVEIDLGAYAKATVNCVEQHFQNPQESAAGCIIQPRLVNSLLHRPGPSRLICKTLDINIDMQFQESSRLEYQLILHQNVVKIPVNQPDRYQALSQIALYKTSRARKEAVLLSKRSLEPPLPHQPFYIGRKWCWQSAPSPGRLGVLASLTLG
ncbi:MAG: LacI family transcriptional regulator [Phycisphaerales bacterium]|nr:LacI family transcriptional regulator [Phycisphaerales bacterium]